MPPLTGIDCPGPLTAQSIGGYQTPVSFVNSPLNATSGTVAIDTTTLTGRDLVITGALTGDVLYTLPLPTSETSLPEWLVINDTTGDHNVSFQGAGAVGSIITVGQNKIALIKGRTTGLRRATADVASP